MDYDRLDGHAAIERALLTWRRGEALARGSKREAMRVAYGRAIQTVVGALEPCTSIGDVVASYERADAPLTHLADRACRALPEGDRLVRALVVDAACWWRLRDLVGSAVRTQPR
jgi:hypothetical protein